MSETRFPSIDNRMKRSLPKFGERCTINRAVFPVGVGVGRGRAYAQGADIATAADKIKIQGLIYSSLFANLFLSAMSNPRRGADHPSAFHRLARTLLPKPGMRVLIADDQRSVGTSLADLVRHCHHEIVAVVGSGVEAIQAYSQHHPDIVLMDYWMPKLNGATACRNILAKDPAARVILVSGWLPANVMAGDSGALALLSKPVDLNNLAVTLDTVAQNLPFQSAATIS
jgi:two-component system chemotaxis response regulator CheY